MSEMEREKQGVYHDPDDEGMGTAPEGVPDVSPGCVFAVLYCGWVLASTGIGVALIESGDLGLARALFAIGVTVILISLPLAWGKGWTDG